MRNRRSLGRRFKSLTWRCATALSAMAVATLASCSSPSDAPDAFDLYGQPTPEFAAAVQSTGAAITRGDAAALTEMQNGVADGAAIPILIANYTGRTITPSPDDYSSYAQGTGNATYNVSCGAGKPVQISIGFDYKGGWAPHLGHIRLTGTGDVTYPAALMSAGPTPAAIVDTESLGIFPPCSA